MYPLVTARLAQDAIYLLVGASAVVAVEVGRRRHAPPSPAAWRWMSAGLLLWVVGDAVSAWIQDVEGLSPAVSWADACYLVAYPMFGIAAVLLIRQCRQRRGLSDVLDSGIVTSGLGLLAWVMLVTPTLRAGESSLLSAVVDVAYPASDIALLGLLVMLLTTGGRTPAFWLLLAGMGALVSADVYSIGMGLWSSSSNSSGELLWLLAYVCWGGAALHPSMAALSAGARPAPQGFSARRMVVVTVAVLIPSGILVVQRLASGSVDALTVAIGGALVALLVLARLHRDMAELVRSHRERDRVQRELAQQAAHDALTGLPNRSQALKAIAAALRRARRSGTTVALLFLDLDGFKAINDTFGHLAGDHVLRCTASRLREGLRSVDFVGRLGGDEFVAVLEELRHGSDAVLVADRMIERVSRPIELPTAPAGRPGHELPPALAAGVRTHTVHDADGRERVVARGLGPQRPSAVVGVSIGIALGPAGATDPDRLMYEADTAAYQAKHAGRGRVEVFDDSMRTELDEQLALDDALRFAIENDELVLHYQPIVDLRTGATTGFEALVRWNRPGHGVLTPDAFLPQAERSSLISDLDRWVLRRLSEQSRTWPAPLRLSANVSRRYLGDPHILADLLDLVPAQGVLALEVNERTLIEQPRALPHLRLLRERGVSVILDDFGISYDSILRLGELPVDAIKTHAALLSLDTGPARMLLELTVALAASHSLPVIAQGVERPDQVERLKNLGCTMAQGYYFGRPAPAGQIRTRPADGSPEPVAPHAPPPPVGARPVAAGAGRVP